MTPVIKEPAASQGAAMARNPTYRTIDSPVGPVTLIGSGRTVVRLVLAGQRAEPDSGGCSGSDANAFPDAVAQLDAYFDGRLRRFDIDVRLDGTDFQRRVWAAAQAIPYGQTRSYSQIAAQIGAPGASRAVGVALGRNPVPIIVACHRVIGSSGALTGYAGGIECKKALIAHEAR
ncbi:MAG: methylated-DNA-[protein]-cysteine S-methyltransferase [Actinomycetota bacterium]|nr:methylated-DNA-[protein]-cysteine S-methyltransferase [Actinomycetota bacterium]